jgi:hypothetical protein
VQRFTLAARKMQQPDQPRLALDQRADGRSLIFADD